LRLGQNREQNINFHHGKGLFKNSKSHDLRTGGQSSSVYVLAREVLDTNYETASVVRRWMVRIITSGFALFVATDTIEVKIVNSID
jgi:hypothetical protein